MPNIGVAGRTIRRRTASMRKHQLQVSVLASRALPGVEDGEYCRSGSQPKLCTTQHTVHHAASFCKAL